MAPSEHRYVDPHYRVAIFGSARVSEHDAEVVEVFRLAREYDRYRTEFDFRGG